MLINKISPYNNYRFLQAKKTQNNAISEPKQDLNSNNTLSLMDYRLAKSLFLSFKAKKSPVENLTSQRVNWTEYASPKTNDIIEEAEQIAAKNGSKIITTTHVYAASLNALKDYTTDILSGEKSYDNITGNFSIPIFLSSQIALGLFEDKKMTKAFAKVLDEEIREVNKILDAEKKPALSTSCVCSLEPSLNNTFNYMFDMTSGSAENDVFSDDILFQTVLLKDKNPVQKQAKSFITNIQKAVMENPSGSDDSPHVQIFDSKANNIWNNFDLGNDMLMIYENDNKNATEFLTKSIIETIKNSDNKYKNISKDNLDIHILNENASFPYINKIVKNAQKNKDKTTVIITDLARTMLNSTALSGNQAGSIVLTPIDTQIIENRNEEGKNQNVRFLFFASEAFYLNNQTNEVVSRPLADYVKQSIPIITADLSRRIFKSNPEIIEKATKKPFSSKAVDRCIESSSLHPGKYPNKALKLMKDIASYYIEEKEIKLTHVNEYLKKTKDLTKISSSNNEFKVTFDTGKKLKDIVGSDMTKTHATSIVRRIKSKNIGTTGFLIYSNNGEPGGGRNNTALAIAGEAGIPLIPINARDFALKDIDALSQNAELSEFKIKKIIALAKAQAEANKYKTAMIYIENFDNFGANPLYGISSIYEQKAFSQLQSEMNDLRKENPDLNIMVMGSVNHPELIDPEILKTNKFKEQIIVYPPRTKEDRLEVLNYYIKKNHFDIAGNTPEKKQELISSMAETSQGASVVDIIDILHKSNIIAKERQHKAIDKMDFLEAFLQVVSGRPALDKITPHRKSIVTSHECGHALTLQIMYEIAKSENIPWHMPKKVDFITLDPRGDYGGAMFPKESENEEFNFAQVFSDLVCDYGGHAAEKNIYNIDGSWGITCDMEMATNMAYTSVEKMTLGPRTGKISIPRTEDGIIDVSEELRENIDKDVQTLLKNANTVAQAIVKTYKGFVLEFTKRHSDKVGTGNCIITSDEFIQELNDWRKKQSPKKQQELKDLNIKILSVIKNTQRGQTVRNINKKG